MRGGKGGIEVNRLVSFGRLQKRQAKGWRWSLSRCVVLCFPFCDLMADIKAAEECLREQSRGKLLSVQRSVIKADRFGLSVPMAPTPGSVAGRTTKMTPEDLGAPGIQRKARPSLRQVRPQDPGDRPSAPSSLHVHLGSRAGLRLSGRRRLKVKHGWLEAYPKVC